MAEEPAAAHVVACPGCGRGNRVPAAATGTPRCPLCKTPLPWLVAAGDDSYDAAVLRSPVPVLVDVWAPWCGPCRMVAPVVEQLARELTGRVKVVKVNADEAPRVTAALGVRGIPTLVLVQDGHVAGQLVGAQPYPALRRWITQTLPELA